MTNGLQQRYRTLGELRTELKARLGFVAQGPSSNNNNAVLNSFLQEGHDYLFAELQPTPSRKKTIIELQAGSYLYDWHNDIEDEDIDPAMVEAVYVINGSDQRIKLTQGIDERDRSYTSRSHPTRYDTLNGQIEVWPVPDRIYSMIVEYIAPRPNFAADADRPGVPDRLILLYAIANAKAHYRHPDAQAAGATFSQMLRKAKAGQHENRRYIVNECRDDVQTVQRGGDGSFTFTVD